VAPGNVSDDVHLREHRLIGIGVVIGILHWHVLSVREHLQEISRV
jgi:hypothetical protein